MKAFFIVYLCSQAINLLCHVEGRKVAAAIICVGFSGWAAYLLSQVW